MTREHAIQVTIDALRVQHGHDHPGPCTCNMLGFGPQAIAVVDALADAGLVFETSQPSRGPR